MSSGSEKKPPQIYIAGPMRGRKWFNFPAFDAAADLLRAEGWGVISPAELDRQTGFEPKKLFREDHDWYDCGEHFDLKAAILRDINGIVECDAIYMLDGWQNSTGASAEKVVAEWAQLKVLYQSNPETRSATAVAQELVYGARNSDYGGPYDDFQRTAGMLNALFADKLKKGFCAHEIGMIMACVKLSRMTVSPDKRDHQDDLAGYAECIRWARQEERDRDC